MQKALICAVQFTMLTALAQAQSPTNAVEEFGLLGSWAIDCAQSPSPRNEHSVFSVTSVGTIQLRNDFGINYDEMVYRVVAAKRLDTDKLQLRQVLTTDRSIVLDVVMLKIDDKVRVWSSRGSDGTALVRDGAIPSTNGQETRWALRCQGRWTDDPASNPDEPRRTFEPGDGGRPRPPGPVMLPGEPLP
jgi:hypothetical protein